MTIWLSQATPESLNEMGKATLLSHLGIEFLEIGEDYLKARMPVDNRTITPFGILHGGASAAFAETLGGIAASLCVDRTKKLCVGLEINANHVRPAKQGFVYGTAKPIHLGNFTQVWEIRICNDEDNLVCVSRLTMAIINKE
ncbi:MAG TPA: hotdog fold thioesterase [Candidatus Bathyarchaeia archaeon]|nr:hotdog fold thioesterase [Candidatus Bathyarchaeia archaeon]